jgi:hypothetical protein
MKIIIDGNFLQYHRDFTPELAQRIMEENNLTMLSVFAHLVTLDGFDFLKDYGFLEGLALSTIPDFTYDFLQYLPNLKFLMIQNEGVSPIDLSAQTKLEELMLVWRKSLTGLENCTQLRKLQINAFKGENLNILKNLTKLERLVVAQCSIKSLDGLENMQQLDEMIVDSCRSLRSVAAINGLKKLNYLEFSACGQIADYDALTDLPNLEHLELYGGKDIKSLQFLRKLTALKKFALLGKMKVADGDLTPALHIPSVFYGHHKTYNIKLPPPVAGRARYS